MTPEALLKARTAYEADATRTHALAFGRAAIRYACLGGLSLEELRAVLAGLFPIFEAHKQEPVAVDWKPCTADEYWYGLEVLPPRYQGAGGFLVGEPEDHTLCEVTGQVCPTWSAFLDLGDGRFFKADRALTVQEFRNSNRP